MMEFIRERAQGLVAVAIILLLCLTFLLWGIESYINAARQVIAAKINGEEIQLAEYQKSFERMRHRAQQEQGAEFNAELWTRDTTKQRVLDALVEERLVKQLVEKSRLRIANGQLAQYISSSEAFMVDGKFSPPRFNQIAQMMGMSDAGLEQQIRADLAQQQIRAGVALSAFALKTEAQQLAQLLDQKRDIAYAMVKPADAKSAAVTDAELETYYKAHQDDFRVPEKLTLEFLELKLEDLKREVAVDEKGLQDYYDAHKANYTTQEQRSVNHVLIAVKKDAPDSAVEAAKLKASLLRGLIASGNKTIEQVAKESSEDIGSKAEGGATGFFPRGVMAPEFEKAAFEMKAGELSQPIRTDFGFHIIKLQDIRAGGTKSFAEARAEVEAAYRTEQAETLLSERAEQFSDALNEHPDSLTAAGERLKLKPETLTAASREVISQRFSDAVAAAAWEPEVLNEGLATPALDIGNNRMVALRVTAREPAKVPPLTELKDTVTEQVKQENVRAAATAKGEALLARLKKGEAAADVMAQEKLDWVKVISANRESTEVSRAVARAAFGVPLKDTDATGFVGVPLGTGAYAVVEVSHLRLPKPEEIEGRKVEAIQRDAESFRLISSWRDFMAELREAASIKTYPKVL
jgi:peptidyl-prolyl cis-trans isomerase D